MDTITTIPNLLRSNGSAHPVTVALMPSEARLIAAAPELLSHLEFAVKLLRPFGHSAQVQAMEAVIAKAKTGGGTRPQPEPQGYDDRPEWEMRTGFREEDFA